MEVFIRCPVRAAFIHNQWTCGLMCWCLHSCRIVHFIETFRACQKSALIHKDINLLLLRIGYNPHSGAIIILRLVRFKCLFYRIISKHSVPFSNNKYIVFKCCDGNICQSMRQVGHLLPLMCIQIQRLIFVQLIVIKTPEYIETIFYSTYSVLSSSVAHRWHSFKTLIIDINNNRIVIVRDPIKSSA